MHASYPRQRPFILKPSRPLSALLIMMALVVMLARLPPSVSTHLSIASDTSGFVPSTGKPSLRLESASALTTASASTISVDAVSCICNDMQDIDVDGTLAYVANGSNGLQIFDASDPASPTLRGGFKTPGFAAAIQVVNNLAYIADENEGLQIIDVNNPASPTLRGNFTAASFGYAQSVAVVGNLAYVAYDDVGLLIIDVVTPAPLRC